MSSKLCLYSGESLGRYGFPACHPFGPWRLEAFMYALRRKQLDKNLSIQSPVDASQKDIERFHSHEYVEFVKEKSKTGAGYLDTGDTPAFPQVYEAAATVVGSCLDAVDRIIGNKFSQAFVPIAGLHHAQRDAAAGFCVFNDCGVVIETLLHIYQLNRVAYIDIDAHHGDGVYYGFENNPRVFIADIHEDGNYLYPGTGDKNEIGIDKAKGTKLNLPLAPGSSDQQFFKAWEKIENFLVDAQPEFIILQCGVDSLAGDPLTHLQLSPKCHHHAANRAAVIANRYSNGRLLAVGGGGYIKANIERGWTAVIEGLLVSQTGN